MALTKVYESAVLPYQTEQTAPAFGWARYNEWLLVPPRQYMETVYRPLGVWVTDDRTVNGIITIHFAYQNQRIMWPGWAVRHHRFDGGLPGPHLGDVDIIAGESGGNWAMTVITLKIARSRHGEFWEKIHGIGRYRLVDPTDWHVVQPEENIWASDFGIAWGNFGAMTPDRVLDRIIHSPGGVHYVEVWVWSTQTFVMRVGMPGRVHDIFPEDESRVYVACDRGVYVLLDFISGRVVGLFSQLDTYQGATSWQDMVHTWDPYLRRILRVEKTPDATDGACTMRVEGFYPVPLGKRLAEPIPLLAPRKGRTVPVLTHLTSDNIEPVPAARVTMTPSGPGTFASLQRTTNEHGYAVFQCRCDDVGVQDMTVTTETPDYG